MSEVEEVKARYARRKGRHPEGYYSPLKPGNTYTHARQMLYLTRALRRNGMDSLADKRIYDMGCGTGKWVRMFIQLGASPENLYGIDALEDRIEKARLLTAQTAHFEVGDAGDTPFGDGSFDIVFQSMALSSVLGDEARQRMAGEGLRILKPGGLFISYDSWMDSPGNRDFRGLRKAEIRRLFKGCEIDFMRVTLAPPVANALAPLSVLLCAALEALRLGNIFYMAVARKGP